MDQEVRLRFAPSPTGYLHIGGARTAIYNWLYAKKTGGKLILRIEDTDAERSTEESIQGILDGLNWLGVTWDEGPYFQSQFGEEHRLAAQKLLTSGHAYKCFCTREALEEKREAAQAQKLDLKYDGTCRGLSPAEVAAKEAVGLPYTIRLKVPHGEGAVVFDDLVYGRVEKKYVDIEDFVIVRSNGQPLYVLSNAVDDARDRISHVLRGQDGLANTPKQILIYQALGLPVPKFAHMSLTLDPKRAKISKRSHGELVAVHFYRDHGFLPWALVNFLVLLGWSNPESREFFSQEELIEAFSLEGINRANSVFNVQKDDPKFITDPKAISMNAHYLRTMPVAELERHVRQELEKTTLWQPEFAGERHEWFLQTLELIRDRFHFLTDFATLGRPYFADEFTVEEKALSKNLLKQPQLKEWLPLVGERFAALTDFSVEETERVVRELIEELDVKAGVLINGIRTVVTGQLKGPGLFDILQTIGQQRVVERLRRTAELFA
ncbi:MAG: glutamate--tRNA ligase [Deltaproteobacteria bacterium]|nr:glutamate--tRNA ligase [Candidatus Anaeroferrophillus wilburensis]MBN2890156.1 glutamate--tRNA ligase [Deltaproteobacteria bacterium]